MKLSYWKQIGLYMLLVVVTACSSGGNDDTPEVPVTPSKPEVKNIPILLDVGVSNARVTDTDYDNGDKIGLYVVNYTENAANNLLSSGNHADNVCFAYNNGIWKTANEIYWKDESTHADFYCYYPYASISDITAHTFSVKQDQSTEAGYKASEFLYGTAKNIAPTEKEVSITSFHSLSCAVIKIVAGNGFTAESLANAKVSVKLNGVKIGASVNLRTGEVIATGDVSSVIPLQAGEVYKALIVPQTVSADNFITVTVDGKDYNLKKEFTYVGGKRHTFTVTVNKTSNGINVGVGDWEDDGVDNGGTAE